MKVAAAQFSLKTVGSEGQFWSRVEKAIKKAAHDGCETVVFPEYFSLSYALCVTNKGTFRERLLGFEREVRSFYERFQDLSDRNEILIVAGTHPAASALLAEATSGSSAGADSPLLVNRCPIFRPRQPLLIQDKMQMTRFESEEWKVTPGPRQLTVFNWHQFKCAVAICYDVEFPQLSRALVAADVDLLFVPSCTEAFHGYWRVRHCAAARAVEGQLCAVVSSCVEGDPQFSEIDVHYGQGAILGPCDGPFPKAGLLAEGEIGDDDLVSATVRLNDLRHLRTAGAVFNQHDVRSAGEITPLMSPV